MYQQVSHINNAHIHCYKSQWCTVEPLNNKGSCARAAWHILGHTYGNSTYLCQVQRQTDGSHTAELNQAISGLVLKWLDSFPVSDRNKGHFGANSFVRLSLSLWSNNTLKY